MRHIISKFGRLKSLGCLIVVITMATPWKTQAIELSDEQIQEIVRRSYPYVALFNVNHKIAVDTSSPMNKSVNYVHILEGWNYIVRLYQLPKRFSM